MSYLLTGDRARWEVMWVVRKDRKPHIVCIEFENDFSGATKLYLKAKAAGKHLATLRCCNVGFPPPEKYRPYYGDVWDGEYRIVRRNGKRFKKKITHVELINPMEEANLKGIWWCPYCREFRRFEHWDGVKTDGSFFKSIQTSKPRWVPMPGMYCPLCGINQNDSHVRRWNPQAVLMEFRINQKRSRNGRKSTRHRTRRR